MREQLRLPGIIGGLGPAAHVEFENRLLREGARRGAQRDQDHIAWVLVNATFVPERTVALLEDNTANCIDALCDAARRLMAAGADFAAVPCNTAHALRDAVVAQTRLPWLDLIDVTCAMLREKYPRGSRVLVLSTTGTMQTGLYRERLRAAGFQAVEFGAESTEQADVMRAIFDSDFGVKATGTRVDERALAIARASLTKAGDIACAVAGCTELSVAFAQASDLPVDVVDPLDALAAATYEVAVGLRRLPELLIAARRS
jgi:aspartate racemase